jgi:DNA-binding GntR family transcriptional regulator
VSLLRLRDARENMFLRRALEGEAAALLATRADPALIALAEASLHRQKAAVEAGDQPGFHRLDLDFHDILTSAVGYPRMRALVEQARLALDRARRVLITPRRHQLSMAEHEAIVAAIREGEGEAARAAMARHIDSVMTELEGFAEANPGAFADQG